MKKTISGISLLLAVTLVCTFLSIPALAADTGNSKLAAAPAKYTLSVDSKDFPLWAYEIDGTAYFKLRDLAMALKDTEKQFTVDWMETRNAVLFYTDKNYSYTPVGGELSQPSALGNRIAQPSAASFYLDDKRILMDAYLVDGSHYVSLSDLEANMGFKAVYDGETHTAVIDTGVYSDSVISFSLPDDLETGGGQFDLTFTRSGEPVGSMTLLTYDPGEPISQLLEGNHRETLSSQTLSGLAYPAAKAVIRVTQPAAAQDNSYVDELHIYILFPDLKCAFDISFDSAKVNEQTEMELVRSLVTDIPAFEKNLAQRQVLFQWIDAVQSGDGKAQVVLMSAKCKVEYYDSYKSSDWVTDASASWLEAYSADVVGNRAIIRYGNIQKSYRTQILTFTEENGGTFIDKMETGKLEMTFPYYIEFYSGYLDEAALTGSEFETCDYDGDGLTDRIYRTVGPDGSSCSYRIDFGNGDRLYLGSFEDNFLGVSLTGCDLTGDGVNEILFCGGHNGSTYPPGGSEIAVFQKTADGYRPLPLPRPDNSFETEQYPAGYNIYAKNLTQNQVTLYCPDLGFEQAVALDDTAYEYAFRGAIGPVGDDAWKISVSDFNGTPALVLYINIGFKYYGKDLAVYLTWQDGAFQPVYAELEN